MKVLKPEGEGVDVDGVNKPEEVRHLLKLYSVAAKGYKLVRPLTSSCAQNCKSLVTKLVANNQL